MAARGELAYSDPIDAHLPAGHRPAVLHGGPVTLLHLATHTSGLPRLPPGMLLNALPAWSTNPYGGYSGEHLLRALARTRIRARPGSRVRYSNYGVGVLGRLLADTAGMGYPQLLNQRVCAPLGLPGTRCAPDPLTQATGHRRGKALPPWSIPGLPGAGAVRSTGRDLARFLAAHIDAAAAPGGMPGSALGGAALAVARRDVQPPPLGKPPSPDPPCLRLQPR